MSDLFPNTLDAPAIAAQRLPRTDKRILAEIPHHLRLEAQQRWEKRAKIQEARESLKNMSKAAREAARAERIARKVAKASKRTRKSTTPTSSL